MQAIEFSTKITPNYTIEVPDAYIALLQKQQKVRIIILVEEEEEKEQGMWDKMATEQFLKGFAEEDGIYDKL